MNWKAVPLEHRMNYYVGATTWKGANASSRESWYIQDPLFTRESKEFSKEVPAETTNWGQIFEGFQIIPNVTWKKCIYTHKNICLI